MKKIKFVALACLCLMFSIQSCQKDDGPIEEVSLERGVSSEILAKLADLQMNINGVKIVDFYLPDGTTKEMIELEGDIYMSEKEIIALSPVVEEQRYNGLSIITML
jgi:hypothetical protein